MDLVRITGNQPNQRNANYESRQTIFLESHRYLISRTLLFAIDEAKCSS